MVVGVFATVLSLPRVFGLLGVFDSLLSGWTVITVLPYIEANG